MWGYNANGQLGDGNYTNSNTPVNITLQFNLDEGEIFDDISLGYSHSSALTSEGRLFTWGSNNYGELGNGTTTTSPLPIDITLQFDLNPQETIVLVVLGGGYSSAITSENRLFTWGTNNAGQLGDGTMASVYTPADIEAQFDLREGEYMSSISLSSSGAHSSALTTDGRLFMWGYNNVGQLGDGTTANAYTPQLTQIRIPYSTDQIIYNYNQTVTISNPTLTGYTFDGWYEDVELTIPYTFTTMPSEDVVVYARWVLIE
jgi:uncharacterized repeat protein (TIGR02543 family)